ncbi:hypothetical protein LOD99_1801 [Oopsacas minuta]|uniref:Tc1-like transposase DDE domain-containing protein n=1 Tax=Oopsacas minuta TaxID=111878 RepID=A0AAV7K5P4_9METZ|nr:hypothetical protein LOD99_1801 [Oopsacas minuta]
MSYQAVSELHIIPPKQNINAAYYMDEILAKTCKDAIKRKRKTGNIFQKRMLPDPLKSIFMQDDAPSHRAKISQEWCYKHLHNFWQKEVWPGNSPDLNPIENLWAILKQKLEEAPQPNNLQDLIFSSEKCWSNLDSSLLENLIVGMPKRIAKCIEL